MKNNIMVWFGDEILHVDNAIAFKLNLKDKQEIDNVIYNRIQKELEIKSNNYKVDPNPFDEYGFGLN